MSTVLLLVLFIALVLPLGRALVRYVESASERQALPPPCTPEEFRALRDEVRVLAERVDKVREDTDFLTRLLEERPARRAIPNAGDGES